MSARDKGWWRDFFPTSRPLFDLIPRRQTNAEVRYITDKLNLRPGSKFLDCPCGIGRITLPLAKKGVRVTAVDITASYLEELESKAKQSELKIRCVHSDMCRIDFREEFDAAANLGTSFGYFDRPTDNMTTLKKAFQALKPGGKFLLQVSNRDWLIAYFVPRDWTDVKGSRLIQQRTFDYENSILRSTWTFLDAGTEKSFQVELHVYSCHEIIDMFTRAGFVDIQAFGSTDDEPVDRNKKMLFVFGTRPKTSKNHGGKS